MQEAEAATRKVDIEADALQAACNSSIYSTQQQKRIVGGERFASSALRAQLRAHDLDVRLEIHLRSREEALPQDFESPPTDVSYICN